jgi:hypothetical protein
LNVSRLPAPSRRTLIGGMASLSLLVMGSAFTTAAVPPTTPERLIHSSSGIVESAYMPAKTREFRVAASGDIACPPRSEITRTACRQRATARLIAGHHVNAVIPLGDTQYETGLLADYRASYAKSWGRLRGISYPVVGNHEYRRPGASGFFTYFKARVPNDRGWYAVNLGRWRLYVLNTNCGFVDCGRQRSWLERDLNRHPRACSMAAMHHPRFSSGGEHGDSHVAARFWPVLDRHQVDVVLAGHDHDYERFAPRHSSGAVAATGMRSFVSGLGGRSLYPFGRIEPSSRARVNHTFGVLFLTLRDQGYSWNFTSVAGRVLDSGSADCVR